MKMMEVKSPIRWWDGDRDEGVDSNDSADVIDFEGYNVEDDDGESEDNTAVEDEEVQEGDSNLETRIEDFINNVLRGQRQQVQRMNENLMRHLSYTNTFVLFLFSWCLVYKSLWRQTHYSS